MDSTLISCALGVAALSPLFMKAKARVELSRAKHRSLRGHSRIGRWMATQVPYYEYDVDRFFRTDEAPPEIAARREAGFYRLAELYRQRFSETARLTAEVEGSISDLQFTETYRVPFQYRRLVREQLRGGAFLESSHGVTVKDLDGNTFYDLTGSYGVNVLGTDAYKACIARGVERARDLGPVLGAYHPIVASNVRRLRDISGLDEVSF